MKCLHCHFEMTNNLVQTRGKRLSYDICDECGSLWLDEGELDKIAFQVKGSIEYCTRDETESTAEKKRVCPRCDNVRMQKVQFLGNSSFLLDRCDNCSGFWLDGGELNLINRKLENIMPIEGKGFSDFVDNVHLPYWHKRIKKRSSETDFRVEILPIKDAKLKKPTELVCPSCKAKLNSYTAFGIAFEGCSKCRGIFLDIGEFRSLKDRIQKGSWSTLRWMDDEVDELEKVNIMPSQRICPKCKDIKFVTAGFGDSSILIDWCPSCHGKWLDGDEFRDVVKYLTSKLVSLSAEEMREKMREEVKEIWGGPENVIAEVLDVTAAFSALVTIKLFERPVLVKILTDFSNSTRFLQL